MLRNMLAHPVIPLKCTPHEIQALKTLASPLVAYRATATICAILLVMAAGLFYLAVYRGDQRAMRRRWQMGVFSGVAAWAVVLAVWVWLQSRINIDPLCSGVYPEPGWALQNLALAVVPTVVLVTLIATLIVVVAVLVFIVHGRGGSRSVDMSAI